MRNSTLSGATIKMRRIFLNLTQKDIAKAMGYSEMFISNIERGKVLIPSKSIKKMAKLLKITHGELVDEYLEDKMNKVMRSLK